MRIILSAEQATKSMKENTEATKALVRWMQNNRFEFLPIVGVWEGRKESSFLVDVHTIKSAHTLIQKASELNQDAVLTMMNDGSNCRLVMLETNEIVHLGTFKTITPFEAKHLQGYSIIQGQYCAAK